MEWHTLQASIGSKIFAVVLSFLPHWLALTLLGLVALAVVATWVFKLVRKIQYRRAVRSGRPVHAAAQYGQRPGSHYLGSYAPAAGQTYGAPTSEAPEPPPGRTPDQSPN
ncbi:hypothetical protein [Wenjunlia tyrosinilytica]|uniref:Uncharacterized protein n=1 Tax=Wenjunlia tyrosinilytica TaxID=1544741 RepID=A0A917ZFB6_9ACTN|nr:hypothetical protein [Wenjunlia tyrosinilytica]GGO82340.1 hypothetical protein GCM10012280_08710 [Wenjunlia tyrosinilytica]